MCFSCRPGSSFARFHDDTVGCLGKQTFWRFPKLVLTPGSQLSEKVMKRSGQHIFFLSLSGAWLSPQKSQIFVFGLKLPVENSWLCVWIPHTWLFCKWRLLITCTKMVAEHQSDRISVCFAVSERMGILTRIVWSLFWTRNCVTKINWFALIESCIGGRQWQAHAGHTEDRWRQKASTKKEQKDKIPVLQRD